MIEDNNKSFCAVPFVSIMVNTDTTIRYCCMVKGNFNKVRNHDDATGKTFYTCKDDFVKEAWNSKDMRELRKSMIAGEKIDGCKVCYMQEENGRTSNRQHSINEWKWRIGNEKFNELVEYAKQHDGVLSDDPVYLDLRLGNLCNLKCRMCNPWNSSQIAKEHLELVDNNSEYTDVWKKTFGKFPSSVMDDQQWFDHDIMWDQVIELIPSLKKVYMTGGEPTLIKNNFKFMEECISRGRKDIVLFFNLNCTNINKRFLDLISQFDHVSINASVDGIGPVNEYIRYPSEWRQISENVEKLAMMKNVRLGITPTVQIYNIFDLMSIMNWTNELNIKYDNSIFIDFLINVHPHQLNISVLPSSIKEKYRLQLVEYRDTILKYHVNCQPMTINGLNGIIGLLEQEQPEDWQEQIKRFIQYTKVLDENRDQDVRTILPEELMSAISNCITSI